MCNIMIGLGQYDTKAIVLGRGCFANVMFVVISILWHQNRLLQMKDVIQCLLKIIIYNIEEMKLETSFIFVLGEAFSCIRACMSGTKHGHEGFTVYRNPYEFSFHSMIWNGFVTWCNCIWVKFGNLLSG